MKGLFRVLAVLAAAATFAAMAAIPAAANGGGAPPKDDHERPTSTDRFFDLGMLNDSGATAHVKFRLTGTSLYVRIDASGLSPNLPHAQHIHGVLDGGPNTCPTMADDTNGDGVLTVAEGAGNYGPIMVSLTTSGDTSPDSALALDRFPVADHKGNLYYERTIEISPELAAQINQVHVVQHGIDFDHSGAYDGDRESSIAPGVPLEATVPANCGPVTNGADKPGDGNDQPAFMDRFFDLGMLNDSGATAHVKFRLTGTSLYVRIDASGLSPNLPHAQHIHGVLDGGPNTCPTMADDTNGDGVLTVAEGAGNYGPIMVSLTTSGDTSPDSALALDRFPVADHKGNLYYERTIEISPELAAQINQVHVVQHGIDFDHSGAYDGDRESSIAPGVPLEATVPANCGPVTNGADKPGDGNDGNDDDDQRFRVNARADRGDAAIGDGVCADARGRCTLRAAVQEANASDGVTRIVLQRNKRYRLTQRGAGENAAASGDLDIAAEVIVIGRNAKLIGKGDRVFDVRDGGELKVRRAVLRHGRSGPADRAVAGDADLVRVRMIARR